MFEPGLVTVAVNGNNTGIWLDEMEVVAGLVLIQSVVVDITNTNAR